MGDSPFSACRLCPHACGVNREKGELGRCRSKATLKVARAALHFWEEPPISGEAGSGTIFFSGCTLGCLYCQNHAISGGGAGREISVDDLALTCLDLERQGAMNINMVTPTHFAPLVREGIARARAWGMALPLVWNTSGYETKCAVADNAGFVDVYLTDFKYVDGGLAKSLSGVSDYAEVATRALDEMVRCAGPVRTDDFGGVKRLVGGVVVRHLVLPGHLDDSKRVLELLQSRYGTRIRVSIMNQYTPVLASAAQAGEASARVALSAHPELANTVSSEDYEELLDFADALGMEDYFWQDGATCEESFIPDFDE